MVVWEDGKMKKSDYRKFIIRTVAGNDDFASMREVITRRYSKLQEEKAGVSGPGSGGRWAGATACRSRCIGGDRRDLAAAGLDRQSARSGSMFTVRKKSRSSWISSRPSCTWCRPFEMKRTGSQSHSIERGATRSV